MSKRRPTKSFFAIPVGTSLALEGGRNPRGYLKLVVAGVSAEAPANPSRSARIQGNVSAIARPPQASTAPAAGGHSGMWPETARNTGDNLDGPSPADSLADMGKGTAAAGLPDQLGCLGPAATARSGSNQRGRQARVSSDVRALSQRLAQRTHMSVPLQETAWSEVTAKRPTTLRRQQQRCG